MIVVEKYETMTFSFAREIVQERLIWSLDIDRLKKMYTVLVYGMSPSTKCDALSYYIICNGNNVDSTYKTSVFDPSFTPSQN